MLLIAIYLYFIFRDNLIYKCIRIGLNGKEFTCYKFKTFYDIPISQEEMEYELAEREKIKLGTFLRRHRLDELPQLFNILRGELSMVGPRPEQKHTSKKYSEILPNYLSRQSVKPGLTGLAQVEQGHVTGIAATRQKLILDLHYIETRSFMLDSLIIIKTAFIVISGRGGK